MSKYLLITLAFLTTHSFAVSDQVDTPETVKVEADTDSPSSQAIAETERKKKLEIRKQILKERAIKDRKNKSTSSIKKENISSLCLYPVSN